MKHKRVSNRDIAYCHSESPILIDNLIIKIAVEEKDLIVEHLNIEGCNFINLKIHIINLNMVFTGCSFKNSQLLGNGRGFNLSFCQSSWTGNKIAKLVVQDYKTLIFWKCLFHNLRHLSRGPIISLKSVNLVAIAFTLFINISRNSVIEMERGNYLELELCSFVNIAQKFLTAAKIMHIRYRKGKVINVSRSRLIYVYSDLLH